MRMFACAGRLKVKSPFASLLTARGGRPPPLKGKTVFTVLFQNIFHVFDSQLRSVIRIRLDRNRPPGQEQVTA
jgi:hypothetical protein